MALVNRSSLSVPVYTGFGASPWNRGLRGCGCGPGGGCGCGGGNGLSGFWDTLSNSIQNIVQGVTASETDPCNPNSPVFDAARCATATYQRSPLLQWIPYIIGGIIVYKLIK
jgi:hypothetical protein